jgi:hypothetical protein
MNDSAQQRARPTTLPTGAASAIVAEPIASTAPAIDSGIVAKRAKKSVRTAAPRRSPNTSARSHKIDRGKVEIAKHLDADDRASGLAFPPHEESVACSSVCNIQVSWFDFIKHTQTG